MNFQASSNNRKLAIEGDNNSCQPRHDSFDRNLSRSMSLRSDKRPTVHHSQSSDNIPRSCETVGAPDCKVTVTSVNFGFSVEMSKENRSVNLMRQLVAQDTLLGPVQADQVVQAAEAMEFEGLMRTLETVETVNLSEISNDVSLPPANVKSRLDSSAIEMAPDVSEALVTAATPIQHSISSESFASKTPMNDDVDTMASILDFTRHHEALMAFYYMDETSGKMKVCEIYGLDNTSGGTDPFGNQHGSLTRSDTVSSRRQTSMRHKNISSQPTSRRHSFSKRKSWAELTMVEPAVTNSLQGTSEKSEAENSV